MFERLRREWRPILQRLAGFLRARCRRHAWDFVCDAGRGDAVRRRLRDHHAFEGLPAHRDDGVAGSTSRRRSARRLPTSRRSTPGSPAYSLIRRGRQAFTARVAARRPRAEDPRRPVLPLGSRTRPGGILAERLAARRRPWRARAHPARRRQPEGPRRAASPRSTRTRTSRSGCSIPSPRARRTSPGSDRLRPRQPPHAQQADGDGQRAGDRRRAQHEPTPTSR